MARAERLMQRLQKLGSDRLQTGMPMPALSVLGASWRLKPEERSLLLGTYIPWALHAGSRSADLMCLYYERHFEVCLSHLTWDWEDAPINCCMPAHAQVLLPSKASPDGRR